MLFKLGFIPGSPFHIIKPAKHHKRINIGLSKVKCVKPNMKKKEKAQYKHYSWEFFRMADTKRLPKVWVHWSLDCRDHLFQLSIPKGGRSGYFVQQGSLNFEAYDRLKGKNKAPFPSAMLWGFYLGDLWGFTPFQLYSMWVHTCPYVPSKSATLPTRVGSTTVECDNHAF